MLEGTQIAQAAVLLVPEMDVQAIVAMVRAVLLVAKMDVQAVHHPVAKAAVQVMAVHHRVMRMVVQAVRHLVVKAAVQVMAVRHHVMQTDAQAVRHPVVEVAAQAMAVRHHAMRMDARAVTAHVAAAVHKDVKVLALWIAIRPALDSVPWDATHLVLEQQWPHKVKSPTESSVGGFVLLNYFTPYQATPSAVQP